MAKSIKKFGFGEMDIAYLMDDQKALLKMELQKKNPSKRFIRLLKEFSTISKRVEAYTAYLKGYDMDTKAMSWIMEMYNTTPPSSNEYKIMDDVMKSYTQVQLWMGNFFSLINAFNHSMNLRRLSTAEKILKKMELELGRGRRIFSKYNSSLKSLKKVIMEGNHEEPSLIYFT